MCSSDINTWRNSLRAEPEGELRSSGSQQGPLDDSSQMGYRGTAGERVSVCSYVCLGGWGSRGDKDRLSKDGGKLQSKVQRLRAHIFH